MTTNSEVYIVTLNSKAQASDFIFLTQPTQHMTMSTEAELLLSGTEEPDFKCLGMMEVGEQ